MPIFKRNERGQIMVLMVVGLVAIMGFAALAVDGSMVYSDRRYDQAAADASALAGGGAAVRWLESNHIYYENFLCSDIGGGLSAGANASLTRATSNFFTTTNYGAAAIPANTNGVQIVCADWDWAAGSHADKYIIVRVQLTSETNTAFAHLIFGGKLRNTVQAEVRVRPRATDAFGYAIVSTSSNCSNGKNGGGVWFDGNQSVIVRNGGVFANSCVGKSGSSGDVTILPSSAGIRYYLENAGPWPGVSPQPLPATAPLPSFDYETPDCNAIPDRGGGHSGGGTLNYGNYDGEISITNDGDHLFLNPGLYCINSLKANGGSIEGTGVTIYVKSGDFSINGGKVKVNLGAQMAEPTTNHAMRGMLIQFASSNSGTLDMHGNSGSTYMGTIYNPNGAIDVGGNSSNMDPISCQIIGNDVKVHGDVTIDLTFSTPNNVNNPAKLDLTR